MKALILLSIQSPILRALPSQDQKGRQHVTITGGKSSYLSDLSLPPAIFPGSQAPKAHTFRSLSQIPDLLPAPLRPSRHTALTPPWSPPPVLLDCLPQALPSLKVLSLLLPVLPSKEPWSQPSTSVSLSCHHFGSSFQNPLPGPLQMLSNQLTWIPAASLPTHFPQHKKQTIIKENSISPLTYSLIHPHTQHHQ